MEWNDNGPQNEDVTLIEIGPQPTSPQATTQVSPYTDPNVTSHLNYHTSSPLSSSVNSSTTTSSSAGSSAPKCNRLLTDLYEEADKLFLLKDSEKPSTFTEASMKSEWMDAMKFELISIEQNKTWSLLDLPKDRSPIRLKWIFKVKKDPNGKIIKHKARLVARGFVQKHGTDYDKDFTPVARIETIHMILSLAGKNGWYVHHLDVKSDFLNRTLEEEVHVTQTEGFKEQGEIEKVYRLSKALYGLKQAPEHGMLA